MEIKISGHATGKLQAFLRDHSQQFDTVIFTNIETSFPEEVKDLVNDYIHAKFDDVTSSRGHYKVPEKHQIQEILDWACGRDKIVVACHAGISRSSAVAFLIAYQEYQDLDKAFAVLDMEKHWPNVLIMKLGAEIFGTPELYDRFIEWHNIKLSKFDDEIYLSPEEQEVEYIEL